MTSAPADLPGGVPIHPGRRRVVITGCGVVTPVGSTVATMWDALVNGRSGIAKIQAFGCDDLPVAIAGEVIDFDPTDYLPKPVIRRLDVFAQYGVAAALQAVDEAGLVIGPQLAPRVGVLIGSGYGARNTIVAAAGRLEAKGPRSISPFFSITSAIDSASGEISMHLGASGPSRSLSSACATGTDCIGQATRWIQASDADVVIAGGAENCLTFVDVASSANARALSTRNDDPEHACRPFDEDRDGFVMSAGAGVLVLEEATHALRRGADVLAEVVGYGSSSDAHHWTAPHPEGTGARRAIAASIADAAVSAAAVDYVNAHGTGTVLNDPAELLAIREVLGARACEIPINSIKSMVGHMIGAAGAVEAISTIHTLRTGIVPPTINCPRPIADDINFVVDCAQPHQVNLALSNSFGFGGHNAVLALRRWIGDI
ncbi:MAG: beta-ketoacyl-ACP synthase II [Actinomycetota bacterium]|nr:beta-ketoacyl-ACP synthase II [Actinomycetota bacterium]